MKKLVLMALFLVPLLVRAQGGNYTLTIKLNALKNPGKAYLISNYGWSNWHVLDSAAMNGDTFLFKGSAGEPIKATILIDHNGHDGTKYNGTADVLLVFIEKGNIMISGTDSVKNATITGSNLNAEYAKYNVEVLAPLENISKAINAEYKAAPEDKKKDKEFTNSLMAKFKIGSAQRDSLKYVYISQNPGSYLSLMALIEVAGNDIDVTKVEPAFERLSDNLKNSKTGVSFANSINAARSTSIGAIAPGFTQNDVNDKPVNLSDFKGKYVLVDFWASWCGPCRAENPNVLKAYNKYKGKNFAILGVSLDSKKESWLEAIKADGLSWTEVSDLNSWHNNVAQKYFIKAIPQNFLIDPAGKIIAKNLRGEDLDAKLASIFN